MTEPTDRLKIRESGKSWLEQQRIEYFDRYKQLAGEIWGHNTSIHTDNNVSGFEFYKDEKLEYQHALMKSHLGFARFHLHHSNQEPPLSEEQIYAMWQEKSREK